jgi:hypothetical protein
MSDLRPLTVAEFNAAVDRGIKQREEKIPSNFRQIARKVIAGMRQPAPSNSRDIRKVDADKQEQMQELKEYKQRMQTKRRALVKLGKNPTREAYLDAGLPLINKDKIKDYIAN